MLLPPNRLQSHHQRIIHEIMVEHNIVPVPHPDHVVRADATFTQVVQHTYRFVGGYRDTQPDYRYRRYQGVLSHLRHNSRRTVHVDIGCGAGLFSWVFLDWATDRGLGHDLVELYGLDHSPQMLVLANEARARLMQTVANYPDLHYAQDPDALLHELTANHQPATDYAITFGHVLVQAHGPEAIHTFTRVIAHILRLMDAQSQCALIAVDALGRPKEFTAGWDALMTGLQQQGILPEQQENNRAKFATLRRIP